MIILKRQLEDNLKTLSILKQIPTTRFIPFNSVSYLELNIKKQDSCLIHLEADYLAETTVQQGQEIIQRRIQRLREQLQQLTEAKQMAEMEKDLQSVFDSKRKSEEDQKNTNESQSQNKTQKTNTPIIQDPPLQQVQQQQQQQQQPANQKNDTPKGEVRQISDEVFEIQEEIGVQEQESNLYKEEEIQIMKQLTQAFVDNDDKLFKELRLKLDQLTVQQKKPQNIELPTFPQQAEVKQEEEEPKRISKFKQDRMNKKK